MMKDPITPTEPSSTRHWLERPTTVRWSVALTTMLFLVMFAAFGVARFGSISAALSYASGKRILLDAPMGPLDEVVAGSTTEVSYQLRNVMPHPVTIQGSETSCDCAVVEGIPCTIEPGGSRSFKLRVIVPVDRDRIWGNLTLFTDEPAIPTIVAGYEAHVIASSTTKTSRIAPG